MKKNEILNYRWHWGTLHAFGNNGNNIKNFVTWSADVSPKEIERYLKKILSDKEFFHKEVEEILFS